MKLKIEQLRIETTLEKFVEDWCEIDELENIKDELEVNGYYEDDDYDYYIEKEDDNLVVTFTGNGNGFVDLFFEIEEKYNSKVLFFQETRYTGHDEIEYVEWEHEYNSDIFKFDIPPLLFKIPVNKNSKFHDPIIVCTNFRNDTWENGELVVKKEKWINKEEEENFDSLLDNHKIDVNGKYTVKKIIHLDEIDEENWYDKFKSIGYEDNLPKEKPDLD